MDVGAVYDPSKHRYDHHQRDFQDTLKGHQMRLSSAGLIYQHFGRQILNIALQHYLNIDDVSDELLDVFYEKVYVDFMEHIDGIDNGVTVADSTLKYHISTTLSARVGYLNLAWNEVNTLESQNTRFATALLMTVTELLEHIHRLSSSWWPARSIVKAALDDKLQYDKEGRIVVLFHYCPWVEHLFEVEKEVCTACSIDVYMS